MVRTKATLATAKVVLSGTIRLVEWTSNQMFGCVESIVIGLLLLTRHSKTTRFDSFSEVNC